MASTRPRKAASTRDAPAPVAVVQTRPKPRHPSAVISARLLDEGLIALTSGRKLQYAVFGRRPTSERVRTAIFFHGTPGSRLDAAYLAESADVLGIRLVALSRPGIGLSDANHQRTVLGFAEDIRQAMDSPELKIQECYLLGYSGGAGYCLACAKCLPDKRILGVGIIAGMPPWQLAHSKLRRSKKLFAGLAQQPLMRWPMDLAFGRAARRQKESSRLMSFEGRMAARIALLPKARREMYKADYRLREVLVASKQETNRDPKGILKDAALLQQDWGFSLENLTTKPISLYYGDADDVTPVEMGMILRDELSKRAEGGRAVLWTLPFRGATHHSIVGNQSFEILKALIS